MNIVKELKVWANSGDFPLKSKVSEIILSQADDEETIKCFFKDLANHGCVSGIVNDLITYVQTQKFFDDYYPEIMDLVYEYEKDTGERVQYEGDLKNWFAWFAFEHLAGELAENLEIETV